MALSFVLTSGNGATTNFAVPFQYIDKTHVHCYVSSVERAFTWVNSSTIQVTPAPAAGTLNVEIRRVTPRDIPLVDFSNGSVLYSTDLDIAALQTLFIAQEFFEQATSTFPSGHTIDSHSDATPGESVLAGSLRIYDSNSKLRALTATDGGLLQGDATQSKGAKFLPVGTNGQTLEVDTTVNGKLAWKSPLRNTLTTKGDILVATGASTPARHAVGNDGGVLIGLSAAGDGLIYQDGLMNGAPLINGQLVVTASGGACTVAVKTLAGVDATSTTPIWAVFRNGSINNGGLNLRKITGALILTIPSGATLGTASGNNYRIHVGLMDNGGTVELFVRNNYDVNSGASFYTESQFISTTSLGVGSNSPFTAYSVTGRPNITWRYAGYFEVNIGTAGTWPSPGYVVTATNNTPQPGRIMQSRFVPNGGYNSTNVVIPSNNSIPQNSQGAQFMSLSVQPISACNILRVTAQSQLCSNSSSDTVTMAMFRDAVVSAKCAGVWLMNGSQPCPLMLQWQELSNTGSVTTFAVRAGSSNAAATIGFNGIVGVGGKLGGVSNSYILIEEIWT